jgi:predicted Ser/Thr protein kinase
MIGRRIRRFEIVAPLGRGGMATVWEAHDPLLGRAVALKLLDPGLAANPRARRRFQREATIAAGLDHPGIAPVYEAGEQEEHAFLVMKRIDGVTLAERARERLLPIPEALRIVAAIANALAYAHGQSVVHRDISPRNVMIAHDGRVYVLDFGLARVPGPHDTTTGTIVGTPAYLAPEILYGAEADARSDLYSLGVVLYETLTGGTPFGGARAEVHAYQAMHADPTPPSRLRPEIGPDLDRLVLRLLERDPARRFASADDLAPAIAALDPAFRGPAAGPAEAGHSATTEARASSRWATGQTQVYVVVTPIAAHGVSADDERVAAQLEQLADAARAGLARADRAHVVAADRGPAAGEDERAFARRVGANLVLRSTARVRGVVVRVTYSFVDPEAGVIVAGGTVEGTTVAPFELEDRLVAALVRALAADEGGGEPTGRRPREPAATEHF